MFWQRGGGKRSVLPADETFPRLNIGSLHHDCDRAAVFPLCHVREGWQAAGEDLEEHHPDEVQETGCPAL